MLKTGDSARCANKFEISTPSRLACKLVIAATTPAAWSRNSSTVRGAVLTLSASYMSTGKNRYFPCGTLKVRMNGPGAIPRSPATRKTDPAGWLTAANAPVVSSIGLLLEEIGRTHFHH